MDCDYIIHQYTDEEAVNDGLLVIISGLKIYIDNTLVDRITKALWVEAIKPVTKNCDGELNTVELEAAISRLITNGRPDDPDMWSFETVLGTCWAVRNERGKWTLMFPSDY